MCAIYGNRCGDIVFVVVVCDRKRISASRAGDLKEACFFHLESCIFRFFRLFKSVNHTLCRICRSPGEVPAECPFRAHTRLCVCVTSVLWFFGFYAIFIFKTKMLWLAQNVWATTCLSTLQPHNDYSVVIQSHFLGLLRAQQLHIAIDKIRTNTMTERPTEKKKEKDHSLICWLAECQIEIIESSGIA